MNIHFLVHLEGSFGSIRNSKSQIDEMLLAFLLTIPKELDIQLGMLECLEDSREFTDEVCSDLAILVYQLEKTDLIIPELTSRGYSACLVEEGSCGFHYEGLRKECIREMHQVLMMEEEYDF